MSTPSTEFKTKVHKVELFISIIPDSLLILLLLLRSIVGPVFRWTSSWTSLSVYHPQSIYRLFNSTSESHEWKLWHAFRPSLCRLLLHDARSGCEARLGVRIMRCVLVFWYFQWILPKYLFGLLGEVYGVPMEHMEPRWIKHKMDSMALVKFYVSRTNAINLLS